MKDKRFCTNEFETATQILPVALNIFLLVFLHKTCILF